VPPVDLPGPRALDGVVAVVDRWAALALAAGEGLVATEGDPVTDGTALHRWYLRFAGEEKEFVTVWLTLRQRNLHFEAQVMPAPDEHAEEVYAYLLRRNVELHQASFALGPEDAIYLVGRTPALSVDDEELDRIAGSCVLYVDEHYPTLMSLGHPAWYRRRRRRA
jgi:Putative bacterial sensory transduction regulator